MSTYATDNATDDCTCCGQELDSAIDDLAMELCGFCIHPHANHDDVQPPVDFNAQWKTCDRCNYDMHRCPGCGWPLKHGVEICRPCWVDATGSDRTAS